MIKQKVTKVDYNVQPGMRGYLIRSIDVSTLDTLDESTEIDEGAAFAILEVISNKQVKVLFLDETETIEGLLYHYTATIDHSDFELGFI